MLTNIKPREYQKNIVKTAISNNTLVVLPTGLGKTLIGLMLAIERMKVYKGRVLFLAPTKPLTEQHYNYFKNNLPELYADMQLFTGKVISDKRMKLWQNADIIFSTPQCIANDLKKGKINLNDVSLLIEDEAHRCLKNYDYVYVAEKYLKQSENPRLLGLTASPGADIAKIKDICKNLNIERVEARTRESEDVKDYLQKLKIETIYIDLPEEFLKIRDLLNKIYQKKIEELKNRKLLFERATKKTLLETQSRIIRAIASGNKNFNLLAGASACALVIKIDYLLELLETQGVESAHKYIQELFKQAEQGKSRAVNQLVKNDIFNKAYVKLTELNNRKIEHPKLKILEKIIRREFLKSFKTKIIVFSQYRDSVTRICKILNRIDREKIIARVFIGQASKKDGKDKGLSQKEQQEIIKEFSLGNINILCATSIGEEGLDLPEVNTVIFYEPIPSAIRKIQRAGRTARLKPGKLITLITKKTRDESYYWAAHYKERKMNRALEKIDSDMKEEKKQKNLNSFT